MYLVCGEALFDFFLVDAQGPMQLGFDARAGGSPFNVAIGIVRQGGAAGLLTGISTDLLGERLAAALAVEGVDRRYLVRSGRRTTLSLVDLTQSDRPRYAFYGLGSADCSLSIADLPAIGPEIVGLHFGSYSIAVEPVADAFADLAARERERFISLDPNVRPTVIASADVWRRRVGALLTHTDLVKVSAEDIGFLYPEGDVARIAADWLGAGPRLVIVTDGADTVTAFTQADRVQVVPPAVEPVDTVGAGDAFQAAVLARLAEHGPPCAALDQLDERGMHALISDAAEVAAETCRRRGADIPRRAARA